MAMTKSSRELAYEALLAVEQDGMQSHLVIRDLLGRKKNDPDADPGLSVRDRAFFIRLVEGTIEYRLQLDYVIDRFSKTKTAKMRPGIREILRMAVYQILYMDSVPDRAAVNEAVGLAVRKGFSGLRGFVNGVLRTIAREKNDLQWPDRKTDPVRALSIQYSIPEDILTAWMPCYGEKKTEEICRSFLEDRALTVHCFGENTSDISSEWMIPTGILENTCFIKQGTDPLTIPAFREGKLYVQDLSSQIAVTAADIQPGERVLDLCAAPGGKSLLAAERGAQVLARDLTEEKAALIRENAARIQPALCSRTDGAGMHISVEAADASVFDPDLEEKFDVVIADLPCSGFGVAGRKPEIKYKPYRETVNALAGLQKRILANAVRYVRPGGRLLYSTCTIAAEENEENAKWLLENHALQPAALSSEVQELLTSRQISAAGPGVQLLPCDGPWDGFFFAVFRKPDQEQTV